MHNSRMWMLVAICFIFALIIIDLVLVVVWYWDSWYFCPTPASAPDINTMKVFQTASLFPYNGNWSSTQTGLTETQCVDQCVLDATCQAFYRHDDPAVCYFYTQPQTQTMLGANVNVSPQFLSPTSFVIGRQTPGYSSTVYIKATTPFSLLPSIYEQPIILLSENC